MQFRAISNENEHMKKNIIEHLSYIFANQMLILSLPVSNKRKLSLQKCKKEDHQFSAHHLQAKVSTYHLHGLAIAKVVP